MSFPPPGLTHRIKPLVLFLLLFGYLSAWAVSRPPFQSPDEFAHLFKAQSTASHPWITSHRQIRLEAGLVNPLALAPTMHRLPFHPEEKLSLADLRELRELEWPPPEQHRNYRFPKEAAALKNPVVYYTGVFTLGQAATAWARLAPYEAFYSYRLAGALLAALAWVWVYRRLDLLGPAKTRVLAFLILIPAVANLGSSINPDGVLIPLSTVTALTVFRALQTGKGWWEAAIAVTLSVFVKISGLVLLLVLSLLGGAFLVAGRFPRHRVLPLALCTGIPAAVFSLVYYQRQKLPKILPISNNPISIIAPGSILESPSQLSSYLASILERVPALVVGFWGDFGWSDYRLPWPLLAILGLLLTANGAAFIRAWPRCRDRLVLSWCVGFGFLFCMAIFGIEFRILDKEPLFIHGRYFLPGAIGIAFVVAHDSRRWSLLLIGFMAFLNAYAIVLGYDRYYDSPTLAWLQALPFVGPP